MREDDGWGGGRRGTRSPHTEASSSQPLLGVVVGMEGPGGRGGVGGGGSWRHSGGGGGGGVGGAASTQACSSWSAAPIGPGVGVPSVRPQLW